MYKIISKLSQIVVVISLFKTILYSNSLTYNSKTDSLKLSQHFENHTVYKRDTFKLIRNHFEKKNVFRTNPTLSSNKNLKNNSNCNISFVQIQDELGNAYSGDYICPGQPKTLYAKAYDPNFNPINGVSFQWHKNGLPIQDANQNTLVITNGGNYTLQSTSPCSVFSNVFEVFDNIITTGILREAEDFSCINTNIKLTAWYTSNFSTYQWQKNGVDIQNATSRVYQANESGNYSVKITDGNCTSNENYRMKLTFSDALVAPLNVQDTLLCGGNTIQLSGTNYVGLYLYTYKWFKNGLEIPNKTESFLNINEEGNYNLEYTNGTCISKSKTVKISNADKLQKPFITNFGTNSICEGSIKITQITINDGTNIFWSDRYGSWYRNNQLVGTDLGAYDAYQSGEYKMVYGSGQCAVESNIVSLKIGENTLEPKIIIYDDESKTNLCGNNDFIVLRFPGYSQLSNASVQWRRNGINLPFGNNDLIFVEDQGEYSMIVYNNGCLSESNKIIITKNSLIKIKSAENNIFCGNKLFRLNTDLVSGAYDGSFVWRKNGVIVPNETFGDLLTKESGSYTVSVNDNGCNAVSAPFYLNVNIPEYLFTVKSGNWNDSSVWICGQIPTLNYNVIISPTHIITMPDNYTGQANNLENNGNLIFGQNASLSLKGQ